MEAAAGIILGNKKILLVRRAPGRSFAGSWGFIGGRKEAQESMNEVVIREVKEEMNLNFQPTRLFHQGKYGQLDFQLFLGEWNGEIVPQQEEVAEWKWFTYQEAITLNLVYDTKDILHNLHQEGLL